MFRIEDLDFEIEKRNLNAYIDEDGPCIVWDVEIAANERNVRGVVTSGTYDENWKPLARTENMVKTRPAELKRWQDIAGRKVSWKTAFDEGEVDTTARMYIFSHENMYQSTFALLPASSNGVVLDWVGRCDVFFNEEKYWENLPFHINTELDFEGILCGGDSEEQCWKNLAPFFPSEQFKYHKTEDGLSMLIPASFESRA